MLDAAKNGHHVDSLVLHHDVEWFLPNEVNKHTYQQFELHPFLGQRGEIAPFAFEIMKMTHPNVVITVGNCDETSFLWSIKSVYPNLFKWIAVVPTGTDFVSEKYRLAMSYADKVIVTTQTALASFKNVKTVSEYVPYGPCHKTFYSIQQPTDFAVLNMGKNSQTSNVPAFLKAIAQSGVKGTLHTNIDDEGEYNVRGLIKRYNVGHLLVLPSKYLSMREGLGDIQVNELYNRHNVIVECSLQSTTALTALEAMSAGCLPVGMEFGAMGEILRSIPQEFRFSVPFETLVGPDEEGLAIISVKELSETIRNIHRNSLSDATWAKEARRVSADIARIFSKDLFVTRVSESLETVVNCDHSITIDSF